MNDYYSTASGISGLLLGLGAYSFFLTAFCIFLIVCQWKIYKKAGKNKNKSKKKEK